MAERRLAKLLALDLNACLLKNGTHQLDLLIEERSKISALEEDVLHLILLQVLLPAWSLDQASEKILPVSNDLLGDARRTEDTPRVGDNWNVNSLLLNRGDVRQDDFP